MRLKITGLELKARGMDVLSKRRVLPFGSRTIGDMLPVLLDRDAIGKSGFVCYRMYRFTPGWKRLRLDLTVFSPALLGDEYNKTLGHYHAVAPSGQSYAEIYQVVRGRASMILQKKSGRGLVDVIIVDMKEGEAVIVPPGYGHVTINKGDGVLIMSDIMLDGPKSDYSGYVKHHGAAYYDTLRGLVSNDSYKPLPKPRKVRAQKYREIYGLFLREPEKFLFLLHPEKTASACKALKLKDIRKA
jgi:glucose-6-phosphate isomerase, archaeal